MFGVSCIALSVLACFGHIAWGIPSLQLIRREDEIDALTRASLLQLGPGSEMNSDTYDIEHLEETMAELERKAEELDTDLQHKAAGGHAAEEDTTLDQRGKILTKSINQLEEHIRKLHRKPCKQASLAEVNAINKHANAERSYESLAELLDQGAELETLVLKLDAMISSGAKEGDTSYGSTSGSSQEGVALDKLVQQTEMELQRLEKRLEGYNTKPHAKIAADAEVDSTEEDDNTAEDTVAKQMVDDDWDESVEESEKVVGGNGGKTRKVIDEKIDTASEEASLDSNVDATTKDEEDGNDEDKMGSAVAQTNDKHDSGSSKDEGDES